MSRPPQRRNGTTATKRSSARRTSKPSRAGSTQRSTKKAASGRKPAAQRAAARTSTARKSTTRKPVAKKATATRTTAKKTAAKKTTAKKTTAKKTASRKPATKKATAKRTTAKKAASRKPAAKRSTARKPVAKKTTARKTTARKTTAKKAASRKPAAKKATAKKSTARKPAARKATSRKSTGRKTTGNKSKQGKTTARSAVERRRAAERGELVSATPGVIDVARRNAVGRSVGRSRPASQTQRTRKPRAKPKTSSNERSRRKRSLRITEVGERYAAYLSLTFLGLSLFGLVMVLSAASVTSLHSEAASPFFQFKSQAQWAAIGLIAFVVAAKIDYRQLRRFAAPGMIVTFALLVVVLIPGVGREVNGAQRWIGVGSFVIQPGELAKLALVIFAADLLARRERRMDRPELTVRPIMLTVLGLSALILLQPKLGTPIILAAVALLLLFVSGARLTSLAGWTTFLVIAAAGAAWIDEERRSRLLSFQDPWQFKQGDGFQLIQSQIGVVDGGLFGVGLGGSKAKWGFLPFAHTDFIFAIVAEELGFIGAVSLIAAFVLVAWLGIRASGRAPDRFGMLLAAGITLWLVFQAFLNIGMVIGVLPVTGETLPFISAGGSSLVTMLTAAGLLTNVARRGVDDD